MTISYIGLGSNLDSPQRQLKCALQALEHNQWIDVCSISAYYRSRAIGPGTQPDYCNAVVAICSSLTPFDLLCQLQRIEDAQGRTRYQRWGARTLDLDILFYGDQRIDTPRLTIPHPRLSERNFVLYPLADIAPNLILPNGLSVGAYLRQTLIDDIPIKINGALR